MTASKIRTPQTQKQGANVHELIRLYRDFCQAQRLSPQAAIIRALQSPEKVALCADLVTFDRKSVDWLAFTQMLSQYPKKSAEKALRIIEIWSNQSQQLPVPKPTCKIIQNLCRAICMNFGQLCELDLSGMPVMTHGSPGEPLSLTYLIEGIPTARFLHRLCLSRCQLGDQGLYLLARTLKQAPELQYLILSANNLTVDSISSLCELVKFQFVKRSQDEWSRSLRTIDGLRTVNTIADAIKADERSTANGTKSQKQFGLKRLDLSCNPLTDKGVSILMECCRDPTGLKAIDLQSTHMTDASAYDILQALQENSELVLVDILNNDIGESISEKIEQRLLQNASYQVLNSQRNSGIGSVENVAQEIRLKSLNEISRALKDPDLTPLNNVDPLLSTYHQEASTPVASYGSLSSLKYSKLGPSKQKRDPAPPKSAKLTKPAPHRAPRTTQNTKMVENENATKHQETIGLDGLCKCASCQITLRMWKKEHEERVRCEQKILELERAIQSIKKGETVSEPNLSALEVAPEINEAVELMNNSIHGFLHVLDRLQGLGIQLPENAKRDFESSVSIFQSNNN